MAADEGQYRYDLFSVLVIEDNTFIRKTVLQILHQVGFRDLYEASDGEEGFRELVRLKPTLVVCDIDMKPMNGLKFLQKLRGDEMVANNQTPVIFLTKHTESEIVLMAMNLGVDAFVVKPPSLKNLSDKATHVLIKHGLLQPMAD